MELRTKATTGKPLDVTKGCFAGSSKPALVEVSERGGAVLSGIVRAAYGGVQWRLMGAAQSTSASFVELNRSAY